MEIFDKFEKNTIRINATHRGGGIEISLDDFGYPNEKMTAYQNYLGGGILGRIENDCTVKDWKQDSDLVEIADNLARYFHTLTNPDTEWEGTSFDDLQNRPTSGY
jgi:hypothetical protein